jgi:hypothetical protein
MRDNDFEIIREITKIETIAVGDAIQDIKRLRRSYGAGRWRKLKGIAKVRLLLVEYALLKCIGMKHTV